MIWHPFLLKNKTTYITKNDVEYKNELDRLIQKYNLYLLQNNIRMNEKYYIQYHTNLIYKISNIGNVYFVSVEL